MKRPRVFVTAIHPGNAIDQLKEGAEVFVTDNPEPLQAPELLLNIADKDAVVATIADTFQADVFDSCPSLKLALMSLSASE